MLHPLTLYRADPFALLRRMGEALDLTEEAVLELRRLPQYYHDPFDRMLICQTIAHGLTLLTPDPQIQEYPVRVVW